MTPIEESDFEAFKAWLAEHQPSDIVATSVSISNGPVARWYAAAHDSQAIFVSIVKHYLSEDDFAHDRFHANPAWALAVERATDLVAEGVQRPIAKREFVEKVLPRALQLLDHTFAAIFCPKCDLVMCLEEYAEHRCSK